MRSRAAVWLSAILAAGALHADTARADEELDLVAVARETDRLGEAGFVEMFARERRVAEIAIRVRRAGLPLCGEHVAPILGLELTTIHDMKYAYLNAAIRQLGTSNDLRVAWVAPGTAAERAGLRPGDVVLSVDGTAVESQVDLNSRPVSPGATSLRFAIERGGEKREIEVPYEPGCSLQPVLEVSSTNNAIAQPNRVVIFSELIRAARNDDEIAAVVGHEFGHKVLEHTRSTPSAEADADYFGLYLVARAGYSPEAGAQLWRRLSRTAPWKLLESETHPSAPQRAVAAARAIDEISAKRAAGRPLTPEGLE